MKSLVKALTVGSSRFAQQPTSSWATGGEPATTGFRHWLLTGTGYSTVQAGPSGSIVIDCVDDSWAYANGSDLVAHREAAFESLLPRPHDNYSNRAVAWPLVTTYYAAYFATQAFLRCLGLGSVYVESAEATQVSAAWAARGSAASLAANNYGFTVDLGLPVTVTLKRMGSGGGVHQQFWSGLGIRQPDLHRALLLSPALSTLSAIERQAADGEYSRLVELCFSDRAVAGKYDFGWLARYRNDINYRFGGRVWLMNRDHSAGLVSSHEASIVRYSSGNKPLPDAKRDFAKQHLAFLAGRFCQVVREATPHFRIP